MITAVISVTLITVALAIAIIVIFALAFVRVKRGAEHDYDYAIPWSLNGNSTNVEPFASNNLSVHNSLYATIEDVEEDVRMRMGENSAYQPSTSFSFARNSAYGTNVSIAPEIETEENAAYHCDTTIL